MRTIRLEGHYSNVNGIQIPPGVYAFDDSVLRDMGQYLLDTGHATEVKLASAKNVEVSTKRVVPFEEMTVTRLKDVAASEDVDLEGATVKADIIAKLVEAGVLPEEV